MKVSDTDRFYEHQVTEYPDGSITVNAVVIVMPEKFTPHTVKQGETLEMLAYKYYSEYTPNASRLSWLIAEANDVIKPWTFDTDFEGKSIEIPDYKEFRIKN